MSRMVIRASLAVMVTDALTGKPVSHLRLRLNGSAAGLGKPGGCWVFLNLAPARYMAAVQAPGYQARTVPVVVEQEFSLLQLALVPDRRVPLSRGAVWMDEPGCQGAAAVAQEERPPLYRIVEPAPAGSEQLTLYGLDDAFSARQVWIHIGNGTGELFWLSPDRQARDRYHLDHPLPWPADAGTQILPVLPVEGGGAWPVFDTCRVLHWLDRTGALLASQEYKGGK